MPKRAHIHVSLDPELFNEVRNRLLESGRDRVRYRAMSGLISGLLQDWLNAEKEKER